MAIESYIHGVGNHHDPRTLKHFMSRNRRSYTREMKIFDNYHLQWQLPSLLHKIENNSRNLSRILSGILNRLKIFQCGKQMRNMYSMEAQRLENTKKKDNNQKNRGDVLKLTIENHKGLEMLSVEALVRDWATIPPPPAPLSFRTTSHCRKLYLFDS